MTSSPTVLVVPCFNEAERLDADALRAVAREADAHLLLVDDGSTDGTAALLADLAQVDPTHVSVRTLPANRGKGEAVRAGLVAALEGGAELVGYIDADLATPPEEVVRLVHHVRAEPDLAVVMASRVGLLGHRIQRSSFRHYTGRIFATVGSAAIRLEVYDTQCGAKVFRRSPTLEAALSTPFTSRWAFDLELLGRLHQGRPGAPAIPLDRWEEVPLRAWRDVGGSKLSPGGALRAGLDLLALRRGIRRWVAAGQGGSSGPR